MSASQMQQWISQRSGLAVLMFFAVPSLFLFLLMKAAGAGQVPEAPVEPFAQKVDVIKVERQNSYTRLVKVVGRVEASKQAGLGFELGGTLLETTVDEGDRVSKGQLLAQLDTQRLDAQLREIEASVARAKADARLAKLSENRIASLVEKNLESPQRLDETREATLAAQAQVREIEARKDSVVVQFTKSKIFSPYNGTILSRPVDPGSVVGQGMTIFTIQKDADTEVRMAMAADKAFKLKKGQAYQLFQGQNALTATLKSIANSRTINTRTVDAIFEIEVTAEGDSVSQNSLANMVLPGDLLTLMLPNETATEGYWVPKSALTNGIRGMWNLFTVGNAEGSQNLTAKSVNVVYSDESKAFVVGSLNAADYVILHGGHRLVPNQKVFAKLVPFPGDESGKQSQLVSL